ncbi:unannotated protein [freshwater metagenome]|uniref:Unannotated protein n=1 Tax=freshwater metagenome TaxID=449393 RepID=A0A6J6NXV9_9ZZZZ
MGAEHERTSLLGLKLAHDSVPKHSCGTEFRNFHKEVHANREEERKATSEEIDIESLGQCGAYVFLAIGNGEREFLNCGRPCFLHVVAGDRD